MSVTKQQTKFEYIADGSTAVFPFLCQIVNASDLIVKVEGIQVNNYRIAGLNNPLGVKIVFNNAPIKGSQVILEHVTQSNLSNISNDVIDDTNIMVKHSFTDAIVRTLHDKNADNISVKDFGAIGDGLTNEDNVFRKIEETLKDKLIDLCGLTYLVTKVYTGNKYCNEIGRAHV